LGRKRRDDKRRFVEKRIFEVKVKRRDNRINTTLGELIATVSECAFEHADDTREAYDLARLVLVEVLKGACPKSEIIEPNFRRNLLH
jgi:hypothetical protein